MREADLQGHLGNNNSKQPIDAAADKGNQVKPEELPLIYTDYQLYQALNILKGIATTR